MLKRIKPLFAANSLKIKDQATIGAHLAYENYSTYKEFYLLLSFGLWQIAVGVTFKSKVSKTIGLGDQMEFF